MLIKSNDNSATWTKFVPDILATKRLVKFLWVNSSVCLLLTRSKHYPDNFGEDRWLQIWWFSFSFVFFYLKNHSPYSSNHQGIMWNYSYLTMSVHQLRLVAHCNAGEGLVAISSTSLKQWGNATWEHWPTWTFYPSHTLLQLRVPRNFSACLVSHVILIIRINQWTKTEVVE